MSTCDSDCICCCCPCITVWAGIYFAYRGVAEGSKWAYNSARRACRSSSDLDGPEVEEKGGHSGISDPARTNIGISGYPYNPYPSMAVHVHRIELTEGHDDGNSQSKRQCSMEEIEETRRTVIQIPPKAIPSMKIANDQYGTQYARSDSRQNPYIVPNRLSTTREEEDNSSISDTSSLASEVGNLGAETRRHAVDTTESLPLPSAIVIVDAK